MDHLAARHGAVAGRHDVAGRPRGRGRRRHGPHARDALRRPRPAARSRADGGGGAVHRRPHRRAVRGRAAVAAGRAGGAAAGRRPGLAHRAGDQHRAGAHRGRRWTASAASTSRSACAATRCRSASRTPTRTCARPSCSGWRPRGCLAVEDSPNGALAAERAGRRGARRALRRGRCPAGPGRVLRTSLVGLTRDDLQASYAEARGERAA